MALPLAVIGMAEVALRLTESAAPDAPPAGLLGLDDPRFYDRDPDLLWRLRRDVVLIGPDAGFEGATIDPRGLRSRVPVGAKQAGELRVVCCGDSVTFGLGLRDVGTVPAQLEAALRAAPELAGRPVRVINAGVPGYGAVQGAAWLAQLDDLAPDAVVWWFGMNDVKPAAGRTDAEWIAAGGFPWGDDGRGALRVVDALRRVVAAPPDASRTRVPPDDYADAARRVAAKYPATVFVEVPQRLDAAAEELEAVAALAREAGAASAAVPERLASPYTPCDLDLATANFTVIGHADGSGAPSATLQWTGNRAPLTSRTLDELDATAAEVRRSERALAALMARLPQDRVAAADLVAPGAESASFSDTCHLTATGAEYAARAIARALVARVVASRK